MAEITKKISDVIKDLQILNNKLPYLLENEFMYEDDLLDMDISLSDLAIHLQLTCMKVEELEHARIMSMKDNVFRGDNVFGDDEICDEEKKLIKQTMMKFLPLMMFYMMIIDKDSILNSKTFGKAPEPLPPLPEIDIDLD